MIEEHQKPPSSGFLYLHLEVPASPRAHPATAPCFRSLGWSSAQATIGTSSKGSVSAGEDLWVGVAVQDLHDRP